MQSLHPFKRHRLDIDARNGLEVVLREDRPLRLVRARGRRIVCTAGCAWITAPGVRADIYLNAGEAWEVGSDGLVLVEAVRSATVAIGAEEQAAAPVFRR